MVGIVSCAFLSCDIVINCAACMLQLHGAAFDSQIPGDMDKVHVFDEFKRILAADSITNSLYVS